MDSKIPLCGNKIENSEYFVCQETNQFYITYFTPSKSKDWSWYFVGLVIATGSSIAALHARIDSFYIPRSSVVSNGLILAVLFVAAVIFHFWAKKKGEKKDQDNKVSSDFIGE